MPELSHIARGTLTHHEKSNGSGSTLGVRGYEIPLTARIVSIVDAFDAMTNCRSYNIVKTDLDAIGALQKHAGSQFDPYIVDVFSTVI